LRFGTWLGTVERVLVPAARETGGAGLGRSSRQSRRQALGLLRLLNRLVAWLNESFVHGVLRLDPGEFLGELRPHIARSMPR
jgi:hypothetical protein